jgi:hypothetical protein
VFDSRDSEISLTFAPAPRSTMSQLRAAVADHQEPDLFCPPGLDMEDIPVLNLDTRPFVHFDFPTPIFLPYLQLNLPSLQL